MRKVLIAGIVCGLLGVANATDFENNLKSTARTTSGIEIAIKSVDPIKGSDGVKFVIASTNNGRSFPLYATNNGKGFIGFSSVFYFNDDEAMATIKKRLDELTVENQKAQAKEIEAIFDKLPKSSFINLKADVKTDKLTTIVTDPDCPYCRQELGNLKEHLKTSNVRIVFAPVRGKNAQVKSALILNETKGVKSTQKDKIINVLNKYYADIQLSEKELNTDIAQIEKDSQIIFGAGPIKGVPFVHVSGQ